MANLETIAHDLLTMQKDVMEASHKAQTAMQSIVSHETLCSERYQTLNRRLDAIPNIFNKLDSIKNIVYIGVGIWIGVPGVLGVVYGFYRLMHGGS